MKTAGLLMAALMVTGCAAAVPAPSARAPVAPPRYPTAGLEGVIGQDAAGLVRLFGSADRDTREGSARRLQFTGPFCVLDTYLYPRASAREPVVAHIDARQPDGRDIDRASCVAAMQRRTGGR